jgi:hypothetical protein
MTGLNNRTSGVFAAATIGGGSTVNGMMLDRGSPSDYVRFQNHFTDRNG